MYTLAHYIGRGIWYIFFFIACIPMGIALAGIELERWASRGAFKKAGLKIHRRSDHGGSKSNESF